MREKETESMTETVCKSIHTHTQKRALYETEKKHGLLRNIWIAPKEKLSGEEVSTVRKST